MSIRPLRTNAGAPVIASSMRCTLGRTRCGAGRRRVRGVVCVARARSKRWARSASSSCSARASASSTVSETPLSVAALEARVVVDADPGEQRDLLAAEPRHAPRAAVRAQPRLLRRDLRAPGGQELANLVPRVHGVESSAARRAVRGPAGTWINRVGQRGAIGASVVHDTDETKETTMQKRTLGDSAGSVGPRPRLHGDEPELPADSRPGRDDRPDPGGSRTRRHVLRHRAGVRAVHERGARRRGARAGPRPGRDRDEVRLRLRRAGPRRPRQPPGDDQAQRRRAR